MNFCGQYMVRDIVNRVCVPHSNISSLFTFLFTCYALPLSACTDPPGIKLFPASNQLVPNNTDTNVTYTCRVDGNRRAEWDFRGFQIPSDSSIILRLASSGIHIVQGANSSETVISITQAGREVYGNQDLMIMCTAITEEGRLDIEASCVYSVRTFGELC